MRYILLLLMPSLLSLLSQQQVIGAIAVQTKDATAQTRRVSTAAPDFWRQAQQLVQEHIYIINRIERALVKSDFNRAESVGVQLSLHLRKVDRFLLSQYPRPDLLCEQGFTNGINLNLQQTQVYCALFASSQQLAPLEQVIENRLPRLADLTIRNPIPPLSRRYNYREPSPSKYLPVPNLPPAEPPLIGFRAKTPIADYVPPLPPAIALPEQAAKTLPVVKQLLASAIAAFPPTTAFTDPAEDALALDRLDYGLYFKEPLQYARFLAEPNTGIVRVLTSEAYRLDLTQTRLLPNVAQRYPFAPLLNSTDGLTPRLALRIENGNFEIAQPELDYGFMVDLGNVPIENLNATLKDIRTVSPQTRQFFLNYRPPTQLDAIQVDRRRFITGKLGDLPLNEPVLARVPAVLNHTYLVRLVQYKLPEVILTSRTVSRRDRRNLDQILATPSTDLLVAFRPVIRRSDGSYTVLWRLLGQFPNPQIEDLEKYVYLE